MQLIRENVKEIIFCLVELIVGILLLINPVGFTSGIIVLAGAVLCSAGILSIYKYFRLEPAEAQKGNLLMLGLILIVMGLFFVIRYNWFIVTFPILTVIYGIGMLVTGMSKIQLMVDMLRLKNKKWIMSGINALVSIICAIIILSSPFSSTAVLWIFTGVSLIVETVLDIVTMIVGYMRDEEGEEIA